LLLLVAVFLLAGCKTGGLTYEVEEVYRPLEKIRERVDLPSVSDTAMTTVGTTAYVVDLEWWLDRYPPGQPRYESIMRHEQVHSRRQIDRGVYLWVARYSYDREFAWAEEQLGWYEELKTLQRYGLPINVESVALILSGYRNLSGRLVSFADARNWVLSVLDGSWTPS